MSLVDAHTSVGAMGRTWRFSRLALQQQLAQHAAVSPSLRTRGA